MRRIAVLAAAVTAAAAFASGAGAATYYVSAAGSDAAAGTSEETAWRTVGKVNAQRFAPGDRVLFRGGDAFTDATLMPRGSGSASDPITFASYGSGRATISNADGAVWFAGRSFLVFDGLDLTTGGAKRNVVAGSPSAGSTDIVIRDSVVRDSAAVGVIAPTDADARWTIESTTFRHIGDSGLIILAPGSTIRGNTIVDVGWNTDISWAKHGVYAKAADLTIAENDISRIGDGQAVSIRFHGARVVGNRVHDTPYAFAFFDYDPAPAPQGTSYIVGNRVWNVSGYAFYYADQRDPNGALPTVDFVVASNTFQLAGGEAINVSESGSAKVTIVNNVFTGTFGSALRTAPTTVAHHNGWSGGTTNLVSGTGDVKLPPLLSAAPDLTPGATSPVVDAGTASVPGVDYTAGCGTAELAFCGGAPDLGAVEYRPPVAPAPAPEPEEDTTRPYVVFSSPKANAVVPLTVTATVTATDAGGVARVVFYRGSSIVCEDTTAPYTCAYTLPAGSNRLQARADDQAGNRSWVSITVSASKSARTISSRRTTASRAATRARAR